MNIFIYWRCLTVLVTFLSLVLAGQVSEAGLHTNTTGHFVRQETTDMMVPAYMLYEKHAKGLLMFNNQQTFCQATILSSTAAVLAASCFDYDGNKQADISQYSLTVEARDAAVVMRAQISNITPHPNYDPETFANNIAVIRFTEITTTLTYMIDNLPSLWESFLHVHFSLNADSTQWNEPQLEDVPLGDHNECGASSSLFQAYPSDYICSVGKVLSMYDKGCNLPYKFIMGHFEIGTGMIGFYSHSSLVGNTPFCDNNQIYSYYLIIAHYIPWINSLIDPDVFAGNRKDAVPDAVNESYSMTSPATGSTNGKIIRSLYKFANVLPVTRNDPPVTPAVVINSVTETETEIVSETETTTAISITTAEPVTVTVTDTVINTEQVTNIVSTTQDITTTSDRTTTVSETVTTTATATATETVTTTLLQTLTGTETAIQSDTLTQSQTLTSLITTTAVSMSECPVVTCDTPVDVSILTVTETEKGTTVEIETVTITELENMTVSNHEFSAVVVTVTISQPPETVTQIVASDQSVDPITVTSVSTTTLVISETETLEGSVESIFATVTTEIEPSSSSAEPEPEPKSDTLQPWMIALIVVIIVAVLLIMGLFVYLYFRWKKRQRELYLASLVTQTNYPQEYLSPKYTSKGYDGYDIPGGYNLPEERQSRYNSKGSYVGYT